MKNSEILKLKIGDCDAGEGLTIADYFKKLLITMWREGESFSGKRPFGNSGWEYDVYKPLIVAGVVEGSLDEYGFVETLDEPKAVELIVELIASSFHA